MTRPVAFVGGRLFDGTSERTLSDMAVLVIGENIVQVATAEQVAIPETAEVRDLRGCTLMPGMVDAHVHLAGDRSFDAGDHLTVPRDLAVLRAADDCRRLLAAGFTTVRDCGSAAALALRRAVAEGSLTGPDIIAAGPIISQTGGHADTHYLNMRAVEADPDVILADGPDECRRAVRLAIRSGSDFIKICTSGGVGSAATEPHDVHFTVEETRAIVDEAHRAGRRVAAHAQGTAGVLQAVRCGVDSIEHGYFLDEECIREILSHGTWLVPTCSLIEVFNAGLADPDGLPPHRRRKQAQVVQAMPDSLRRAVDAGVRIAAGSDYLGVPNRRHGDNSDEAISMVKHGVPPIDALRCITSNGAALIGAEDRIGCVTAGRRADLVVVRGDPSVDITDLRHVELVMKAGTVHCLRQP